MAARDGAVLFQQQVGACASDSAAGIRQGKGSATSSPRLLQYIDFSVGRIPKQEIGLLLSIDIPGCTL